MKTNYLLLICFLVFFINPSFSQKLTLIANHSDAKFTLLDDLDDTDRQELGVGSTIEYKLDKDSRNRIRISKPGYQSVIKEFDKDLKWEKEQKIILDTRQVDISAEPFDAEIHVDGKLIGTKSIFIFIGKDRFLTVEVKKQGFAPVSKVYYNQPDRETPPLKDFFILKDRQVRLEVSPADATVTINGITLGRGNQDVKVPFGDCVTTTVTKEGFVTFQKVFCNKEGDPEPPIRDKAVLEDRLVKITTAPADAAIEIGGKRVGNGSYDLKVPKNACVEVRVTRDGFVQYRKNYCNQTNMQEPPMTDFLELPVDEAYTSSVSSDLANVRITVPVRAGISAEEAWKVLSSIITGYFDILETVDFNTGYLTTSWQVQNFQSSIIRTRVIVSSGGNTDKIAYAVKLVSQEAKVFGDEKVTVKDDELFEDWARILKKYDGLIQEIQARLQ